VLGPALAGGRGTRYARRLTETTPSRPDKARHLAVARFDATLATDGAQAAARAALALPHAVGMDARIACLERARAVLRTHETTLRGEVGLELAVCLYRRGRARAALTTVADTLAAAQEACQEEVAVVAEVIGAMIASRLGSRVESDLLFDAARERAARAGAGSLGFVTGARAVRDLEHDDPGSAEAGIARSLELADGTQTRGLVVWLEACRARALARCGRVAEAADALSPALTRAADKGPEDLVAHCLDAFAEVSLLAGRPDESVLATTTATSIRTLIGFPRVEHELAVAQRVAGCCGERRLPALSGLEATGLAETTLRELTR
jgi:hypothetical protein